LRSYTSSFSALQRAENSSINASSTTPAQNRAFQCSSASRKFLNRFGYDSEGFVIDVSVLFSEPKIPQCYVHETVVQMLARFSALQRAENSSIFHYPKERTKTAYSFSALQRAENSSIERGKSAMCADRDRFSALQRAENSSIGTQPRSLSTRGQVSVLFSEPKIPQSIRARVEGLRPNGFSALQRAENSSMLTYAKEAHQKGAVSVLFSEPKIPQFPAGRGDAAHQSLVSVLFSEPKIPQ